MVKPQTQNGIQNLEGPAKDSASEYSPIHTATLAEIFASQGPYRPGHRHTRAGRGNGTRKRESA